MRERERRERKTEEERAGGGLRRRGRSRRWPANKSSEREGGARAPRCERKRAGKKTSVTVSWASPETD